MIFALQGVIVAFGSGGSGGRRGTAGGGGGRRGQRWPDRRLSVPHHCRPTHQVTARRREKKTKSSKLEKITKQLNIKIERCAYAATTDESNDGQVLPGIAHQPTERRGGVRE